jgi:DNA-binding winged helix-turn-helix (wHTH) protein
MSRAQKLRFAAFEVDPLRGELRKHGIRIKLQEQPFKILLALLEKPGEVVTREELRQRIWGDGTFVDFDHGLSTAVNCLREALGDAAENPRYIETMARRGYRFIAAVEGAPLPSAAVRPKLNQRLGWATCLLLAVAGTALWVTRDRAMAPVSRVVPLTTLTGFETHPAFSPDGNQVAFTWTGEGDDNPDVYVKVVGGTSVLRLTRDPAADLLPAWSPDGRQIAFFSTRGGGGIYLVPSLTGAGK